MAESSSSGADAFTAIYSEHHGWLHQWLWGKMGCSHQAADLAQDTFVKLLTQKTTPELLQPRAFLQVLARRGLCDLWRRRELERAYSEALASTPCDQVMSEESRALLLEALEQVDRALNKLAPAVRRVFLMSQLQGRTYSAIADEMCISQMTVRRHMKRAILACVSARAE